MAADHECHVHGCRGGSTVRANQACDACWVGREDVLLKLPRLWLGVQNLLPPGSRGYSEAAVPSVAGPRSPLNVCALDALHSSAMELNSWASYCQESRGRPPIPTAGKRWGYLLSRAIGTLFALDEFLHYHEQAPCYLTDLYRLRHRLTLLAGLDRLVHRLDGVECPRCNRHGLIRHNGQETVCCPSCGLRIGDAEYRRYVLVLVRSLKRASVASPEGDRA